MKYSKLLLALPIALVSLTGCDLFKKDNKTSNKEAFDDSKSDYYLLIEQRNSFDKSNNRGF